MTATISFELKQVNGQWAVQMLSACDDMPELNSDMTYTFLSEAEARQGLTRALLSAEILRKEGTIGRIEVRGEVVAHLVS